MKPFTIKGNATGNQAWWHALLHHQLTAKERLIASLTQPQVAVYNALEHEPMHLDEVSYIVLGSRLAGLGWIEYDKEYKRINDEASGVLGYLCQVGLAQKRGEKFRLRSS